MRHWFGRRGNFLVFLLSEKEPFAASLSRRGPRVTAHHNLYSTEKMYNERDGSERRRIPNVTHITSCRSLGEAAEDVLERRERKTNQ
jgi:hypothetical protein